MIDFLQQEAGAYSVELVADGATIISLSGTPSAVEILIERDGTEVAHDTFAPAYQLSAPNGEECGPICNNATVSLAP